LVKQSRESHGEGVLQEPTRTEPAKADVRRLDKPTAMRTTRALQYFVDSGEGDVKVPEATGSS